MVTDDDPDGYGSYVYESTVRRPDGIVINVQVAVPVRSLWNASSERAAPEDIIPIITHNAAAGAAKQIEQAKNEVPF